jgi:uncharacterized protein DUF4166
MTSARLSNLASSSEILLDDHRFHALLPDDEWGRLPLAVWRRFSKRLAGGKTVVYVGEIEESRHSRAGWWLAQMTRLIGGPLPTGSETGVPIIVTVTEDAAGGGQIWTRICARSKGFPQVIHSAKRFAGPTGLEEYIGCGISMALRLSVAQEALLVPVTSSASAHSACRCRNGSRRAGSPSAMPISAAAHSASRSNSCIRAGEC